MYEQIEDYPKTSIKEFLILEMLIHTPGMYGLEMVESSGGEIKRGTIYPTLQRMMEKQYVQSKEEPRTQPEIGIPRRKYEITEYGKRVYYKNSEIKKMLRGELLTMDEAAKLLYVSDGTMGLWIEVGEVPYIVGSDDEIRIERDSIFRDETKSFLDEGLKWQGMRTEEAIPHGEYWFNKAIESNNKYALAVHELGRLFYTFGHYYKAVEFLKKAAELNPDAMPPSMNLGMNFFEMQLYRDAEQCFRNVVRNSPDFAKGWYQLGITLSMLGFYNKQKAVDAIESLKRARSLNPNSPETFWFLSRLYVLPTYGISDFVSAESLANEIKHDFPEWAEEIKLLISLNNHSLVLG